MRTAETILWQPLRWKGADFCSLMRAGTGWELSGVALGLLQRQAFRAVYHVTCDAQWHTRQVEVQFDWGKSRRSLKLRANRQGRWWDGRREIAAFRGCYDIDLFFTPATNTLPIRRLRLKTGQTANVKAAWISNPQFKLRPLAQTYTRLARNQYRYTSDTGFAADLTVQASGLVELYPGVWQRA